jgi:hypothetical protein
MEFDTIVIGSGQVGSPLALALARTVGRSLWSSEAATWAAHA